ncbi:MAG TPA: ABC transporter ATP-binding protein [Alphaproteobacteria bacterium]|nr:ABC transporter ATP-binding protein [Alphaproteobacteria bacterium]
MLEAVARRTAAHYRRRYRPAEGDIAIGLGDGRRWKAGPSEFAARATEVSSLNVERISRSHLTVEPFALADGECVVVSGPSGAGKSLLLRAIADLDPNESEILLDAERREALPAPLWRRRVTYVAAESGWWADAVGAHFAHRDAAAALAQSLGLPAACLDWPVSRLSTGERQRLALVRALVQKPRALLLDEPTSGLDQNAAEAVETLLKAALAHDTAILMVSHDPAQAARLARRQLRVEAGRVWEDRR